MRAGVVLLGLVAAMGGVVGLGTNATADACALTRSVTDPDTGYVYTFPVDNPIPPAGDPGACDFDHGSSDPFVPVQQPDGSWVYGRPASVEPGFAAVPAVVPSCPGVIQYSARGTREDLAAADGGLNPQKWWSKSGLADDHGAGVVGGAVHDRLTGYFPDAALYADHYPADYLPNGSNLVQIAGLYTGSIRYGAAQAVADLTTLHTACPSSKLLVTGYSQGADVIRRALADPALPAGLNGVNTLVELFGDPNFQPTEGIAHGTFTAPHSGIENSGHAFIPAPGQIPARFTVHTWCHDYDPACQGDSTAIDQHLTYGAQDSYAAAAVAARHFGYTGSPVAPTARNLGDACVSLVPGTTQVKILFDNTASTAPVTFVGTVGYTSNGGIVPALAPLTRTVAAGQTSTWTQNLPFVFGRHRFLFDVTVQGSVNPAAKTSSGGTVPQQLHTTFHDTLC
ncbi:hypothetical protein GCM10027589_54740 [Actinocorallia lasiicapitis]